MGTKMDNLGFTQKWAVIDLILKKNKKNLPDDERMKFRKKRMETAAEGKQAPLRIECPWLYTNIKNKK